VLSNFGSVVCNGQLTLLFKQLLQFLLDRQTEAEANRSQTMIPYDTSERNPDSNAEGTSLDINSALETR